MVESSEGTAIHSLCTPKKQQRHLMCTRTCVAPRFSIELIFEPKDTDVNRISPALLIITEVHKSL